MSTFKTYITAENTLPVRDLELADETQDLDDSQDS